MNLLVCWKSYTVSAVSLAVSFHREPRDAVSGNHVDGVRHWDRQRHRHRCRLAEEPTGSAVHVATHYCHVSHTEQTHMYRTGEI